MKIKNIILSFCVILSAFSFVSPNKCSAETVKEKYSMCFSESKSGKVSVQNITDADKSELARLVSDTDRDMAKYLGNGFNTPDMNRMINDVSDDTIKLIVRAPEGYVVGQIVLGCANDHNFHIMYWIGQDFRGRGYMSSAMTTVMQKIWEIDSSAKFFFAIDDGNIASIKVMENACVNLDANLAICESHKLELKVSKIDDVNYNLRILEDGVESGSYPISGSQLLQNFPKECIDRGVLTSVNATQYVVFR